MTRDEFKQLLKEALIELAEEGYLASKEDIQESKAIPSQPIRPSTKTAGLQKVAEVKAKNAPLIRPQPPEQSPFSNLGAFASIFEDTAKTTLVEQIQAETRGYTDRDVQVDEAQVNALISPDVANQFKNFFGKKRARSPG